MRRRSNTINADNVDDYLKMAQKPSSGIPAGSRSGSARLIKTPKSDLPNQKSMSLDNLDMNPDDVPDGELDCQRKPRKDPKEQDNQNYWGEFDFDCKDDNTNNIEKDLTEVFRVPSIALSGDTADTDDSEDAEGKSLRSSILRRIMVIGLNGSGKHSLIRSTFECEDKGMENVKPVMDLLVKTEQEEEERCDVRYQFWIRNLKDEDVSKGMLENIMKVYYKNVSLFVFMYSVTCRESFLRLNKAIQAVMEEVPEDKFTGVLLGTKCDCEEQREVTIFEGISLQEKYKLTFFMETNQDDKSLKGRLVKLLNEADGVEKLRRSQNHSILSVE
jgi:hypothetical protein